MGLSGLDAALSGLRLAQQQVGVISNNISNVGTPGFTRKILPQSSQTIQGQSIGVLSETIIRRVDLNLTRDLWTQVSASGSSDIQATYLKRIESFHGAPDKELSISAEIGRLFDTFTGLSDDPSSPILLSNGLNQAIDTATKINELSQLITTLRNDAQSEMKLSVDRINDLLTNIAALNRDIKTNRIGERTVAQLEDSRDEAIKELAGFIDISFFQRGDGVLVVQTGSGSELASDFVPRQLFFSPTPISSQNSYPTGVAGITLGDPATDTVSFDITPLGLGGKLGGLINLRDETFPKQMAQLDELAHKLALRFDAQGLRLFTDATGSIPLDTAPNPLAPTAVSYVGFSLVMQVNQAVLNDSSLLQRGTYGASIPSGSNEVIRRIVQNAFGDVDYQQAVGNIDLVVSSLAPPNNTLHNFLGIDSINNINGSRNLSNFADPASFIAAANGQLAPGSNTFQIIFSNPTIGIPATSVEVILSAVPNGPGNFAQDLVNYINTGVIPTLTFGQQANLNAMNVSFSVGTNGEMVISSNGVIQNDATAVANGMGANGLALFGLAETTYQATNPYFDIQVGNGTPTRIFIDGNDTEVDLMAKLAAVPGLAVENITTSVDGFLRIRPGNNYTNPDFGGDIKITSGPFRTTNAGANAVYGPGTIPNGVNMISAMFGSFSTGPLQDVSPVQSVNYASQTNASLTPPIPTTLFRTSFLGPDANISTGLAGSRTLQDYAQKMVNEQTQDLRFAEERKSDSDGLRDLLQRQFLDESGVNIDEELGNLIVVQTAYSASARVLNAINELFDELLRAVQ
jgi:flagellar hook-associated protein 1 FlgK